MEPYFDIQYKLTKSDKFEEFMKALGVSLVLRKLASSATPIIKLSQENGKYVFYTLSTFKTNRMEFTPGVEFEEETMDGRRVKSVVTFNNNKMIQTQNGVHTVEIVREFSSSSVVATFSVNNVSCRRIYERVAS